MTKRNRRVWNLFIDPAALARLSIPFVFSLLANLALILLVYRRSSDAINKTKYDYPNFVEPLTALNTQITTALIWGVIGIGAVNFILWLVISHRILGPTVSIRRHIENMLKGDYESRLKLRPNDELKEVANDLNKLSEKLKSRPS